MALTTFSDLKTAIQNWADDSDVASFAEDYIAIVEARFNRELRVGDMEASDTLTPDSVGEVAVPADFLEVRRVYAVSTPQETLQFVEPDLLKYMYPQDIAGNPKFYTIEAGKFRVRPIPSGDIVVKYYQEIPALSDGNTTNWLLTKSPGLYLYAAEAEHAYKIHDYERLSIAGSRMAEVMDSLMREDKGKRWPNAAARVRGLTP